MKRIPLLALLALLLGTSPAAGATVPWTTVADLESHAVETRALRACGDPRPMGVYVTADGPASYYALISADLRWVIAGPVAESDDVRIWYGTVTAAGELETEDSFLGTAATDVCPLLAAQRA